METSRTSPRLGLDPNRPRDAIKALAACVSLILLMAYPIRAQAPDGASAPSIVVTTEMLGWLVGELVPGEADVAVLMHGVDPHAWEPSARDIEAFFGADLIVTNGLGLEAGLHDALEEAKSEGIPIFEATQHITVRQSEAHDAVGDPHFWLDPLAMREVARALVPTLGNVGVDVGDRGDVVAATLYGLWAEAGTILNAVPPEARKLVSGHESLGYFADRYGFELIGAIVPGLSSQGEGSAGELAELIETIRREQVPAIFTELGTPAAVVDAVAAETGAKVVELPTEQLPADGSYETFLKTIATRIAGALTSRGRQG
jgi:zinc/manganese transport system substrate-binding protein